MKKKLFISLGSLLLLLTVTLLLFSWGPPTRLTYTARNTWLGEMAIGGGIFSNNFHVVYVERYTSSRTEIFYKKSTDYGVTWLAPVRLTWTNAHSYKPQIALDTSQNIHVLYTDNISGLTRIYHRRSTDGGATWSSPALISTGLATDPDITIRVVHPKTYIHCVYSTYTSTRGWDVAYKCNTNGGSSWSTSYFGINMTSGSGRQPTVAADTKGNVHIAFRDNTPGNTEIYYKKMINNGYGGVSSGAAQRLSWTAGGTSTEPFITVDPSDNIYLASSDNASGDYEIYFRNNDGITPWSIVKRLTYTSGDAREPNLCVKETLKVHLAFHDDARASNYEIYYKYSSDGGNVWGGLARLTYNSGSSKSPYMDVDYTNKDTHLIWDDDTTGNMEINYKKD